MADSATSAKVCVACGTDCAGKPRTKDSHGRYMCKPCFDKAQAKAAAKTKPMPEPETIPVEDDGGVLASLIESEGPAAVTTAPCPSCGAGLMQGAVICTTCGHDLRTGRGVRSRVTKEKGEGAAEAAAVAGAVAAVPMVLLIGCVCAAIGGGLGAGLWAFIAYNTGYGIGWIAWGIGALSGIGMAIGVRGHAGMITGALAAAIALMSLAGGKYMAVSAIVDHEIKKGLNVRTLVTDEYATALIARDVVREFTEAGKKVEWPDGEAPDRPRTQAEFPQNVWAEADSRWKAMDPELRQQKKNDLESEIQARIDQKKEEFKDRIFMASFGVFDILWAVLAVGSAFKIGSGLNQG